MKKFEIKNNVATSANDRYWQFAVGSCHLGLALRADYREQLKIVHDELGFERVRCHGVFHDDMKIFQNAAEFIPLPTLKKFKTKSFFQVAWIYDALLEMGIKPFVELGFMPKHMASGKRTVFNYRSNITPPKNYQEWADFVESFIRFLIDRYGAEEVRTWYFEVWNEPDLKYVFWTGTKKDYFKLYKYTVEAIKKVDPLLKVGGPSTAGTRWIKDTIDFCKENNLPLDFASTHLYPGDVDNTINMAGPIIKQYFNLRKDRKKGLSVKHGVNGLMYSDLVHRSVKKDAVLKKVLKAEEEAGGVPLYFTEWNINATCTAPQHDTKESACYVLKTVLDWQGHMQGSTFWCFSDLFEEISFFPEPFSGSFGLMTVYGVKKPSFWAFKFLSELGDERLNLPLTHEETEIAAFKSEKEIQVLLYRQLFDDKGNFENVDVSLDVAGEIDTATVKKIDNDNANPISVWEKMGKPQILTKAQAAAINDASAPVERELPYQKTDSGISFKATLKDNDIHLVKIKLK